MRSAAPQGSGTSQELEKLKVRLVAAEELTRGQEAVLENVQMATTAELEDLCAVTAEGLTDVHAANMSELVTSTLAS